MTASGAPSATASPAATSSSASTPSCSETTSCSIFIASITITGAPALTRTPDRDGAETTVPANGATNVILGGTARSLWIAHTAFVSDQPELVWTPSDERAGSTTLAHYQQWLHDSRGLTFDSYDELWRWSVTELDEFWQTIVEYFEVRFGAGGEPRWPIAGCPGRSGSRGRPSPIPSTSFVAATTTRSRSCTLRARPSWPLDLGGAA